MTQEIHFAAITARDCCADVIFVHGLTGEAVGTWTSQGATEPEGEYWPKWLSTDLPNLSFYTLGYPASIFAQWARKEMALYERAKNSLELLAGYDFGKRPIIFICHSLGGLLTKQLLRTAKESVDAGWQRIADSCVGILFLATPHTGSSLANLLKAFSGPLSSTHIDKLLKDSSELDELNESFRAFCYRRQIDVFAYYEKYKTLRAAIIVDKASADPGVNGMGPVPVDANHLDICKPSSRHSFVYLSVFRRLEALQARLGHIASTGAFQADDLHEANVLDRRDLHTKMSAATREHEYLFANDSQNKFARSFARQGLMTGASRLHNNLLADIEQRFQSLIFHPLICNGADNVTVSAAVQAQVIDPLSHKYTANEASAKTIMNALYFLTERCHIRWDKP